MSEKNHLALKKDLRCVKKYFNCGDYVRCIKALEAIINSQNLPYLRGQCVKELSGRLVDKCHLILQSMFSQNVTVNKFMIHVLNTAYKADEENRLYAAELFEQILELQSISATESHLSMEFVCLYNYLVVCLTTDTSYVNNWCTGAWTLIYKTLERAYQVSSGCYRSVTQLLLDDRIYLSQILYRRLSKASLESLCYLCFAIGMLSALRRQFMTVSTISLTLRKVALHLMDSGSQMTSEIEFLFARSKLPLCDLHTLTVACIKMKDNKLGEAMFHLKRISCPGWAYFVLYMKAFIRFQVNDLNSCIKTCMEVWRNRDHISEKLVARFCNLLGCCHFLEQRLSESKEWFRTAFKIDCEFLLPLYNLSQTQVELGHVLKSRNTLKQLVEVSPYSNSYCSIIFNCLLGKYEAEMSCLETMYCLAHHYTKYENYLEASTVFTKMITYLDPQQCKILPVCCHWKMPKFLYQIYLEASYACLQARQFKKCLEFCDVVENFMPCVYEYGSLASESFTYVEPAHFSLKADSSLFPLRKRPDIPHQASFSMCVGTGGAKQNIYYRAQLFEMMLHHIMKLLIEAGAVHSRTGINAAAIILKSASIIITELLTRKCTDFKKKEELLEKGCEPELMQNACPFFGNEGNVDEDVIVTKSDDIEALFDLSTFQDSDDDDESSSMDPETDFDDECRDITAKYEKQWQLLNNVNFALDVKEENCLFAQILNNMALASIANNRLDEASDYMKTASENDPDNIDVIYNCCLLELKKGNSEEAVSIWTSAKHKIPFINNISQNMHVFPYSVTIEQLKILDSLIVSIIDENEMLVDFDISWD